MGSNPTLGKYFLLIITSMAAGKIGLRLKGHMDPRACLCRGLMSRSSQLSSMTVYPIKD